MSLLTVDGSDGERGNPGEHRTSRNSISENGRIGGYAAQIATCASKRLTHEGATDTHSESSSRYVGSTFVSVWWCLGAWKICYHWFEQLKEKQDCSLGKINAYKTKKTLLAENLLENGTKIKEMTQFLVDRKNDKNLLEKKRKVFC